MSGDSRNPNELIMKQIILSICAALAPLGAQQIWKVNCHGGPGVHFTDLPPAVAAAAPGDEIRLFNTGVPCSGGSSYTATIINKPLRIVGFNSSGGVANTPSAVNVVGLLLIMGIASGEQVVISNVSASTAGLPGGIVALNCPGQVLLEDVSFIASGYPDAYWRFEGCADVVIRGGEIRLGGSPLRFINSNALISWCSAYHTPPSGIAPPLFSYKQTAEGIRMTNSTVTLVGSLIRGSNRYSYNPWLSWLERPAVYIESGTLRLGPSAALLGGSGGNPSPTYSYLIEDPATGTVEEDSRASVNRYPVAGVNCCAPVPKEMHSVHHRWLVAGESYEIYAYGPSGGFAAMMLGDWNPYPTSTPWGLLAIEPASAQILDIVPLTAADGLYQWNGSVPATMAVAHAFAFQALMLSPNGELQLSIPSQFAVGWPHGVVP